MIQIEVKEKSNDEIKQGDYVITIDNKEVVLIESYPNAGDTFIGQVVKGSNYFARGYYSNTWEKEHFRKFYGTITIKCD